jgi:transcriptional regulator with XRE-family HTH domain
MTPEAISLEIGRKLRERRRELRLSLAQVAGRCGVSFQQVHKYEIGHNAISAPMLWTLARCLGVPIGYFFEGLDASASTELERNKAFEAGE